MGHLSKQKVGNSVQTLLGSVWIIVETSNSYKPIWTKILWCNYTNVQEQPVYEWGKRFFFNLWHRMLYIFFKILFLTQPPLAVTTYDADEKEALRFLGVLYFYRWRAQRGLEFLRMIVNILYNMYSRYYFNSFNFKFVQGFCLCYCFLSWYLL